MIVGPPENEIKRLPLTHTQRRVLLLSVVVSSASGVAAQLLLGNFAAYLSGDAALAYGIAVGCFLAAMGIGSWLSQTVDRERLLQAIATLAIATAPAIALLPLVVFASFTFGENLWGALVLATLTIGGIVGVHVPLAIRLLTDRERRDRLEATLSRVLTLDYLGALVGAIGLPLVVLPSLGVFPAAVVLGLAPVLVALVLVRVAPELASLERAGRVTAIAILLLLPLSQPLGNTIENRLYGGPIVHRQQTTYQRIVLTRASSDTRLFLDGDLQFSTLDEHRYHEALIHPTLAAAALTKDPERVLVLGAGDGLAARRVLQWSSVREVVLLELDPAVVALARRHPALVAANGGILDDPRLEIRYGDALREIDRLPGRFDAIVADFPDPDSKAIAKLYSEGFYRKVKSRLKPGGAFVTQATSSFFAPRAFSSIIKTIASAGFATHPFRVDVPSFGPWGFVLATPEPVAIADLQLPDEIETRFLTPEVLQGLFALPKDETVAPNDVEINRLVHPVVVNYYRDRRWRQY